MFIVINKVTNKIIYTAGENFGIQVTEDKLLQEITDEVLINKIESSHDYVLIFDEEGNVVDMNVLKTWEQWQQENQPIPSLSEIQQQKILELNTACNNLILTGFPSSCTGIEHQYKFDMEYQANFAQQGVMLSLDPTISTVLWPTSDEGVRPHSREQFIRLCQDAQTWKATNTYRYFGLKAQVLSCETVDAVNAIVW